MKYCEHFWPEYIPNLSSAKSPQQMFGALIKTFYAEKMGVDPADIVSVALMPCSAKKFECNRPEMRDSGYKDVDFGLTTRELGSMFRQAGLHVPTMPKSDFDDPFGTATGSGLIFGATGGVMESALRTVLELVTGRKLETIYEHGDIIPVRGFEGVRYAELTIGEVGPVPGILAHLVPNWDWLKGATLKVAVAHGTANARKVMEDIKAGGRFSECHFIEFMACPGGCLGGGGQPIPTSKEIGRRGLGPYGEEKELNSARPREPGGSSASTRVPTDGPCGHKTHELLHTHYTDRASTSTESASRRLDPPGPNTQNDEGASRTRGPFRSHRSHRPGPSRRSQPFSAKWRNSAGLPSVIFSGLNIAKSMTLRSDAISGVNSILARTSLSKSIPGAISMSFRRPPSRVNTARSVT